MNKIEQNGKRKITTGREQLGFNCGAGDVEGINYYGLYDPLIGICNLLMAVLLLCRQSFVHVCNSPQRGVVHVIKICFVLSDSTFIEVHFGIKIQKCAK